jgi:hypothetical protein
MNSALLNNAVDNSSSTNNQNFNFYLQSEDNKGLDQTASKRDNELFDG